MNIDETYSALFRSLYPFLEEGLKQEMLTAGVIKTFKENEQIMRTGQYFTSTVLILKGLVKLYREGDEGEEFFMYYIEPGQACALSMICATKSESSQVMAKAVSETVVFAVPIQLMDEWMKKYKTWYYFVLETYRSRFEELLVVVDNIAFKAMDERLVFYLQKHQKTLASSIIPVNHQTIANELGTSREVISRLLKKLEQLGRVKLHRNHIELIKL
ncbi:MAG: Crp/Fnr family transcriptional regulator [Bacteroidia bacterium]